MEKAENNPSKIDNFENTLHKLLWFSWPFLVLLKIFENKFIEVGWLVAISRYFLAPPLLVLLTFCSIRFIRGVLGQPVYVRGKEIIRQPFKLFAIIIYLWLAAIAGTLLYLLRYLW